MARSKVEKVEGAKPRRRWPIVLGAIVVVLALLVGALLLYANTPDEETPMPEAVSAEARERNTLIATSLVVGGIEDSFVDVTPERVFVSYELPPREGSANETDDFLQQFALGAAARGASTSERAEIVQLIDGVPRLTWKVEVAKVTAFLEGEISEEELMAAIERSTF